MKIDEHLAVQVVLALSALNVVYLMKSDKDSQLEDERDYYKRDECDYLMVFVHELRLGNLKDGSLWKIEHANDFESAYPEDGPDDNLTQRRHLLNIT